MNWIAALTTGVGLGLVHFAGLWWTVRRLDRPAGRLLLGVSRLARFALAAAVFLALSREGAMILLVALAGFLLARLGLLLRLRGLDHA